MKTKEREIIGPASSYYVSQRLRLHYVDWGNEDKPLLVLIHGGRDHARSWDWVARELRNDWHVVAPDLRGHGDSSWAIGGHYTINEFTLDISQLLDTLGEFPVTIVAHSLGGAVTLQYASVYPDRIAKLAIVEGLGPPRAMVEQIANQPQWERMDRWIHQVRDFASRMPKRYPSIDAAAERMLQENSFLSPDQARHLTVHGVARNEDGTYSWKFDNYVRVFYPQKFDLEERTRMWSRINAPVCLISGAQSWEGGAAEDGRIDAFPDATRVTVEKAGHWVHHDQLEQFLEILDDFL
jgi:pimeloyl-ACP methyl ester carboxylesterase